VFLLILMLVSGTIEATTGQVYRIDTQNLQDIRQVSHLVNHPVLREVVLEWMNSVPRGKIEISYVQGKDGEALSLGLRSGLIALGIPSKSISLHGSKNDMRYMELRVTSAEKP